MRKTVPYVAAWFLAGLAAVAIASAGVSLVGRQVTGNHPAPLSAEQVRDEVAAKVGPPVSTAGGSTSTTSTTAPPAGATTTTVGGPPVTPPPVEGGPTTTTPSGGPSGGGSGQATTTPPAPAPTAATGETRSYRLVGGTATLRFTPSGVTVVSATPNAGFEVELSDTHDTGVRVEFDSDDRRSRVDAWWDGGPQDEVRED